MCWTRHLLAVSQTDTCSFRETASWLGQWTKKRWRLRRLWRKRDRIVCAPRVSGTSWFSAAVVMPRWKHSWIWPANVPRRSAGDRVLGVVELFDRLLIECFHPQLRSNLWTSWKFVGKVCVKLECWPYSISPSPCQVEYEIHSFTLTLLTIFIQSAGVLLK